MKTWLKIFFRNSKKNWLNLAVNISGLTLGLAGLIIVLLYFNDEKSYNATNPFKNEIHRVTHDFENGPIFTACSSKEGPAYVDGIPEIDDFYLGNIGYQSTMVKSGNKSSYVKKILTGKPNFFDFFPFNILEGSTQKFSEARNMVAISKEKANLLFGNTSALGKSIEVYNISYNIAAVYEIEKKSYYEPELIKQFKTYPDDRWGDESYTLLLKLKAGSDKEGVQSKIDDLQDRLRYGPIAEEHNATIAQVRAKFGYNVKLDPLSNIRLKSYAPNDAGPEGAGNYQLILIMLALSVLLIFISCINFINLSTASAFQRAKEVGVKKTLGLSKLQLVVQYLSEVVFQCVLALVLALVLVEFLLPLFNTFIAKDLSLLDADIIFQVTLVALVVSLIVGGIPALYLSKFKSIEVLKGNFSRSKKGALIRNGMLAMQFLISGFFLIGVLIIYSQINYMVNKDLGFKSDQVLIVNFMGNDNNYKKYNVSKTELSKHPNIDIVSSNFILPGRKAECPCTSFVYLEESVSATVNPIDFEYLNLLNIKLLKGRMLSSKFASDTIKNILINESLAKAVGIYDNPIGKKVSGALDDMEVVGMVQDYFVQGFDNQIKPMYLLHWNTLDWTKDVFNNIQFKISSNDIPETIAYIENYWAANIEQGYPFDYAFLDENFAKSYKKYKDQQSMFFVLTIVVILISLLGLFALATLNIQQRLKEVAIRKTLGASVKSIITQLLKNFVKITLIAVVILLPIAYYVMQNWLSNFAFRIDMPIWPFIVTPIILVTLVIGVVGIKAYNATKVDLIKYLKFE